MLINVMLIKKKKHVRLCFNIFFSSGFFHKEACPKHSTLTIFAMKPSLYLFYCYFQEIQPNLIHHRNIRQLPTHHLYKVTHHLHILLTSQGLIHRPNSNQGLIHRPNSNQGLIHRPNSNQVLIHRPNSNQVLIHLLIWHHLLTHLLQAKYEKFLLRMFFFFRRRNFCLFYIAVTRYPAKFMGESSFYDILIISYRGINNMSQTSALLNFLWYLATAMTFFLLY